MKPAEVVLIAWMMLLPVHAWGGDGQMPDADMLEFLGQFETSGGQALDPLLFEQGGDVQRKKEQPPASASERKRKKLPTRKEQKEPDNEK